MKPDTSPNAFLWRAVCSFLFSTIYLAGYVLWGVEGFIWASIGFGYAMGALSLLLFVAVSLLGEPK